MPPCFLQETILVLRHVQSFCVSSGPECPASFSPASSRRLKAYDLPLQLPRTAANSNFANQQDLPTIYKTHRLPRGAASFKSLYLKRPFQSTSIRLPVVKWAPQIQPKDFSVLIRDVGVSPREGL
jgi:hypothetical protein